MKYTKQVNHEHYSFEKYIDIYRWASYYYQIDSVFYVMDLLQKSPQDTRVLEIGPGDKTVSTILKQRGLALQTMDVAKDLHPDIVAALPTIPAKQKQDIIVCCEVLEHLQYEDVEKSLREMSQKSKYVVLSVPQKGLHVSLQMRMSLFKPLKKLFQLPSPSIEHTFDGEHYWELGTKGYSVNRFKSSIKKSGFQLIKDFRLVENPYHHFFIAKSK
jgi:hypothetical protein